MMTESREGLEKRLGSHIGPAVSHLIHPPDWCPLPFEPFEAAVLHSRDASFARLVWEWMQDMVFRQGREREGAAAGIKMCL